MTTANKITITLFLLSLGVNVNFYMVNDKLIEENTNLEEALSVDIETRITDTINSVATLSCIDTANYICSFHADCSQRNTEALQYFCDTAGERL